MKLNLLLDQIEVEKIHKNISNNVKNARLKKGVSQLDIATTMGFKSATFYSNAEGNMYGKHFNIEHIFMIAKYLQIDPCSLIYQGQKRGVAFKKQLQDL
jgi:transcriptional regulator with XRE-family HTH domain